MATSKNIKSTAVDTRVNASITLKKSAATAILAPYRESDRSVVAKVLTLAPFTGKGHTAASIIRDTLTAAHTYGIPVPSGFKDSEVGRALTVARAMRDTELPTEIADSARAGIIVALMGIERAHATVGGGKTGVIAALEVASKGENNPAQIAETLTAQAASILDAHNARRRAVASPASRPGAIGTRGAQAPAQADGDAAQGTAQAPAAPAQTAPAATPTTTPAPATPTAPAVLSLADVTLTRLFAEIDRRVVAGHVLTKGERKRFDTLASNLEAQLIAAMADA